VSGNVIDWTPDAAPLAAPRAKWKALVDPWRTPLLPFRYITSMRLEGYYSRTIVDRELALKWSRHYLANLELPASATILDFGCGRGRTVGLLSQLGHRVVGQELRPHRWWSKLRDCGFQTGMDLQRLPWPDGAFDAVVEVEILHYLAPSQAAAHAREIHRVLRVGGYWLLVEANAAGAGSAHIAKQVGALHALADVRTWAAAAGLDEVDVAYEGYYAPRFATAVNFARKQLSFANFDLADFDSSLAQRLAPEQRGLWRLRLRKPAS
jgi:SAM-dependent methyltransferase